MKGSVYKRCACGITGGGGGRRSACKKDHGSWYYVADLDGANGKRKQEKRGGFPDRTAAEEALAAVVKAVTDGTHADDGRLTVGAFLDAWLDEKIANGLRPGTIRSYRQHIRDYLAPHLGRLRLRELRPTHVQKMLTAIGAGDDGLAAATVRRVHATLRTALATAYRRQLVAVNVADSERVDLPSAGRPKVHPWEPAELGRFLDSCADDRLGGLYEVIASTGLRRGEACGMRWSDVDLARGVLVVNQQLVELHLPEAQRPVCELCGAKHKGVTFGPPKTSSGEARRVELDEITTGALLAQKLRQDAEKSDWERAYADHDLVFARENGVPLNLPWVTHYFTKLCRAAGVRVIRLHDLRHGAASLRLAAGADMTAVSKMLGHSSVSITSDTYSHLLENVARDITTRENSLVPRRAPRDQSVTNKQKTGPGEIPETGSDLVRRVGLEPTTRGLRVRDLEYRELSRRAGACHFRR